MNRLTGFEEGYSLRYDVTKKLIDNKLSMINFMRSMDNHNYFLTDEERLYLARVDAAIDVLLDIYHKIVISIDS